MPPEDGAPDTEAEGSRAMKYRNKWAEAMTAVEVVRRKRRADALRALRRTDRMLAVNTSAPTHSQAGALTFSAAPCAASRATLPA